MTKQYSKLACMPGSIRQQKLESGCFGYLTSDTHIYILCYKYVYIYICVCIIYIMFLYYIYIIYGYTPVKFNMEAQNGYDQ